MDYENREPIENPEHRALGFLRLSVNDLIHLRTNKKWKGEIVNAYIVEHQKHTKLPDDAWEKIKEALMTQEDLLENWILAYLADDSERCKKIDRGIFDIAMKRAEPTVTGIQRRLGYKAKSTIATLSETGSTNVQAIAARRKKGNSDSVRPKGF